MSEAFPDSVRIVLFDETNPDPESFLLVAESDDPTNLKLPGGKFEGDESPEQAANRELLEEAGLIAEEVSLRAVGVLPNQKDNSSVRYIFVGRTAAAAVQPGPDISETLWVTRETLPEGKNKGHILEALDLVQLNHSQ